MPIVEDDNQAKKSIEAEKLLSRINSQPPILVQPPSQKPPRQLLEVIKSSLPLDSTVSDSICIGVPKDPGRKLVQLSLFSPTDGKERAKMCSHCWYSRAAPTIWYSARTLAITDAYLSQSYKWSWIHCDECDVLSAYLGCDQETAQQAVYDISFWLHAIAPYHASTRNLSQEWRKTFNVLASQRVQMPRKFFLLRPSTLQKYGYLQQHTRSNTDHDRQNVEMSDLVRIMGSEECDSPQEYEDTNHALPAPSVCKDIRHLPGFDAGWASSQQSLINEWHDDEYASGDDESEYQAASESDEYDSDEGHENCWTKDEFEDATMGLENEARDLFNSIDIDDSSKISQLRAALNPPSELSAQETELHAACAAGSETGVLAQLLTDVNVNVTGGFDGSALNIAARLGHTEVVELLLQAKAIDVDRVSGFYGTALQAASAGGHNEIVKMLLGSGSSTETSGGDFGTALCAAAYFKHFHVVELLVRASKPGWRVPRTDGRCSLHQACIRGSSSLVKLLLHNGVDPNQALSPPDTPLLLACRGGHAAVVKHLIDHGANLSIDKSSPNTKSALSAAIDSDSDQIVDMLLRHGAEVDIMCLKKAISKSAETVLELLIKSLPPVPDSDHLKYKAFMFSIAEAKVEVATLLAGMMPVNWTQPFVEEQPLITAIKLDQSDIVDVLVVAGADIDHHSVTGVTALTDAAMKGDLKLVRKLLNYGADLELTDPLLSAARNTKPDVVAELLSHGANREALHSAIIQNSQKALVCLLDAGVDIDMCGSDGVTALCLAARHGRDGMMPALLSRGAKVDASPSRKHNTLYVAATQKSPLCVNHLLKVSAYMPAVDLICQDGDESALGIMLEEARRQNILIDGSTGLYLAALHGHFNVVDSLISTHGTHVNTVSGWYGTPIQAATVRGHTEIVDLLLCEGADPTAPGGCYRSALEAACSLGFVDIVDLYLTPFNETLFSYTYLEQSLTAASFVGHCEIVSRLLDTGAMLHETSMSSCNALHAACVGGHEDTVKMLLKHGADQNCPSEMFMNAVDAATQNNHPHIVRMLQSGRHSETISPPFRQTHSAAVRQRRGRKILGTRSSRQAPTAKCMEATFTFRASQKWSQ